MFSRIVEQVRSGRSEKLGEQTEQIQGRLNAIFVEFLSFVFQPFSEPIESYLKEARKAFFAIREQTGEEHASAPAFYLGQLSAITELAEMVLHRAVPQKAASILARSDVAREVAKVVLERGSIGPSELASRLGKKSQNLVPVTKEMVHAGLVRRDEFGRRRTIFANSSHSNSGLADGRKRGANCSWGISS